jgi:uncharacterized protein (TIGR03437 family)
MSRRLSFSIALAGLLATHNLMWAQGEGPIGTLTFDGRNNAFPAGLSATTFRAQLSSSNEVPPVDGNVASGKATISIVRGGTERDPVNFVEFQVDYLFTINATITGMHIHSAAAGTNGPIVVDSGLPNGPIAVEAGKRGAIKAVVRDSQWAQAIERNPSAFYVNLHTTANPGGVMRGQLTASKQLIAGADMRTGNEVPAVPQDGIAAGFAIATFTRDANNVIDSAEVRFIVKYRFPAAQFLGPQTITGLHIHSGPAGTNGPVILDSGINAALGLRVAESGEGTVDVRNEIDVTDPVKRRAIEALAESGGAYYMNIHTNGFPAGFARGQVRPADRIVFGVPLARAGAAEAADAAFVADVLRNSNGVIESGLSSFVVLHRNFSKGTEFTGLHIHEGYAGTNGPVRIDSGLTRASGFTSTGDPGLISTLTAFSDPVTSTAVQDMLANIIDQGYYMNLHTVELPGGAIRGQMGAGAVVASSSFASVVEVTSAINLDPPLRTLAPGGRVAIYGDFLVAPAGLGSDQPGAFFPTALNGLSVMIGGQPAPLVFIDRTQIQALVPFSTPLGNSRPLMVRLVNGQYSSAPFSVSVQQYAPGIFITEGGAEVFREGDQGLVRPDNPARPGEKIRVMATGLGQTTPPLADGSPAPDESRGLARTNTVTATIGGASATVVSSVATPGLAGRYTVTVEVPAGTAAGDQPLVLTIGGVTSNRVSVSVAR